MIAFICRALRVSCCVLLMLMETSCIRHSYWVKLSDSVAIADARIEFQPKDQLRPDEDFQWVLLDLEAPFKLGGEGVQLPDGEVINPEIDVIDQYGNSFTFVWRGTRGGGPIYGYTVGSDKLPRDRQYKAVRIRSPRPIECKAIYWFCESSKDWK